MRLIKDEDVPFTCKITNSFCGKDIRSLYIMLDEDVITSIPISGEIAEKINQRLIRKISKTIIETIKDGMQSR